MNESLKIMIMKIAKIITKLFKQEFSGELRLNFHKGFLSKKIKKMTSEDLE